MGYHCTCPFCGKTAEFVSMTAEAPRSVPAAIGSKKRIRRGEHEFPATWTKYAWTGVKGYGAGKNRDKERIWFSPHCLPLEGAASQQGELFSDSRKGAVHA